MPKPPVSPAPAGKPLNLRQQRFVQEYLVDGVAAAAARRAGYSQKSSLYSGHQLMRNPRIKAAIAAEKARRAGPMTRREAVEALRQIAQATVLDYARPGPDGALELDLWRLERDRAGAVKGLTVTERTDVATGTVTRTVAFTLADRSAALIKLLPTLEADETEAVLERGREEGREQGIAVVAQMTPAEFGRFRQALAQVARQRTRPALATVVDDFLAQEAAARPTQAQAAIDAALAAREAELAAREAELDQEWEHVTQEGRELTERSHALARREAAVVEAERRG